MALILILIIVLNIVAIALTYYCLSNLEKKEKLIFIVVGIAIVYMLTSFVYWLSTKNVAIKEVSEATKNIITFIFVPTNGILILPILAKSYSKYKIGGLASDKFRNRAIVLAVILLIILIIECSYFKDIQNGIVSVVEENNKKNSVVVQTTQNEIAETNTQVNEKSSKEQANLVSNNINVNNNVNESVNNTNELD